MHSFLNTADISAGRYKQYIFLKKDIAAIKANPFLKDINFSFVAYFKEYLSKKPGSINNANTITRKIKMLKAIVHFV